MESEMASKQIWISTPDPSLPPGSRYVRRSIILPLGQPVSLKHISVFGGVGLCASGYVQHGPGAGHALCGVAGGVGNPDHFPEGDRKVEQLPSVATTETYRWDGGSQFTLVRTDHLPEGDSKVEHALDLDPPSFTTRDYRPY